MKVKDFVECLDIFQGIKLIDAENKAPYQKNGHWDKFGAAKFFGDWNVYLAYTANDGDLILEIETEEI